ncbi:hypothetical protein ACFW4M_12270 [Streptomyces sp. NPDC058794]|uniref:hypothetical protein n=1 Tax=unclassified Streptomyces TaxID=2593676 RepID=UPI0036BE1F51
MQFTGRRPYHRGRHHDGAPGADGFLARYERDGRTTAVLAGDRPRSFMRARRGLAREAELFGPAQP